MLHVVSLSCTNCSANLTVDQNMGRFACGYCGAQLVVERSGGTVSLKLVEETLKSIRTGTDKTAAELAYRRLCEEVAPLRAEASQLKWDVQHYESYVIAEREVVAANERTARHVSALKAEIQALRAKEREGKFGCFATIVGAAILLVFLSQKGWLTVAAVVIGSLIVGVKFLAMILSSDQLNLESQAQVAEWEEARAKEQESAARALTHEWAGKRAVALSQLAILEPQIQELERRILENKRIADS